MISTLLGFSFTVNNIIICNYDNKYYCGDLKPAVIIRIFSGHKNIKNIKF